MYCGWYNMFEFYHRPSTSRGWCWFLSCSTLWTTPYMHFRSSPVWVSGATDAVSQCCLLPCHSPAPWPSCHHLSPLILPLSLLIFPQSHMLQNSPMPHRRSLFWPLMYYRSLFFFYWSLPLRWRRSVAWLSLTWRWWQWVNFLITNKFVVIVSGSWFAAHRSHHNFLYPNYQANHSDCVHCRMIPAPEAAC